MHATPQLLAFVESLQQRVDPSVQQHHIGRRPGRIAAAGGHPDTHAGRSDRGGVVDPVADHRGNQPGALESLHHLHLVFGRHPGKDQP